MIVVLLKLDTFVIHLITFQSKLFDEYSVNEILIIQKNDKLRYVVNFWNFVHVNTMKLWGITFLAVTDKAIEKFCCLLFQLVISMQM